MFNICYCRDRSHGSINAAADNNPNDLGPRTVKEKFNVEGTSYHRIETAMKCCSCTEVNRHKLWFQILTFSLVLLFDVSDVVTDWSLFKDVLHIEPGLVFGPAEPAIIYALLAFSALGTMTFTVEIFNVWLEIFFYSPILDPELLCMCTIWIEDIPQIILSILLAVCREYAVSYFQIIKVVLVILGSFVRLLMGFIRFVDRKNPSEHEEKHKPKTGLRHLFYRVMIIIGLLFLFFSSMTVCFLTMFERTKEGNVKFNQPKGLFHGKYDRLKFFNNVNLYLNLPTFEYSNITNVGKMNWIQLTSIWDVKYGNNNTFQLSYDNSTQTKFVLSVQKLNKTNQTESESTICFYLNRSNQSLANGPADCQNFLVNDQTVAFIFRFSAVPEKIPQMVFGDIHYNVKCKDHNGCQNITLQPLSELGQHAGKGEYQHPTIHYYKTKYNVTDHLITDSTNTPRFYHLNGDLINITDVWKTGFGLCESTGSLAPHRNESIPLDCA